MTTRLAATRRLDRHVRRIAARKAIAEDADTKRLLRKVRRALARELAKEALGDG